MNGSIKIANIKVRFLATLIDFLVTAFICTIVIFIPSNCILHIYNELNTQIWVTIFEILFLLFVYIVFITIFLIYSTIALGKFGATIGKMMLKLRIVDIYCKRISYRYAFKRTLLLVFYTSLGYGIMWKLFDENMLSIYDKKLNLRVIINS